MPHLPVSAVNFKAISFTFQSNAQRKRYALTLFLPPRSPFSAVSHCLPEKKKSLMSVQLTRLQFCGKV